MLSGQHLKAVHQRGLNIMNELEVLMMEILYSYHEKCWENTEVNDRKMRGEPMREGELAHGRDIVDDIPYAMTDDGSKHSDKREENSWPVVAVGKEEVRHGYQPGWQGQGPAGI